MAVGNVLDRRPRVLLILGAAMLLLTPVALVVSWIVVTWAGWSVSLVLGGVLASAAIVLLGRAQPVESGGTTREEPSDEERRSDGDALDAGRESTDGPDPGHPDRTR